MLIGNCNLGFTFSKVFRVTAVTNIILGTWCYFGVLGLMSLMGFLLILTTGPIRLGSIPHHHLKKL